MPFQLRRGRRARSGEGAASPLTTAKAPLTIASGSPRQSSAVASDIFVAGSKAGSLTQLRRVGDALRRRGRANGGVDRVLPALGTRERRQRQHVRLVEAAHRRTSVTVSSLRVSVPVLSAHSTSIVAASSTAERRVGSTPSRARARAPSAAARVNVAGSATGIEASTAVRTSGMISPSGI